MRTCRFPYVLKSCEFRAIDAGMQAPPLPQLTSLRFFAAGAIVLLHMQAPVFLLLFLIYAGSWALWFFVERPCRKWIIGTIKPSGIALKT